jgi:hypothetical protein
VVPDADVVAGADEGVPRDVMHDGREHFSFVETQPSSAKRNPQLFKGKYITITRWADGSLHPNFRPMKTGAGFRVEHYAFEVYRELYKALKGLVEK